LEHQYAQEINVWRLKIFLTPFYFSPFIFHIGETKIKNSTYYMDQFQRKQIFHRFKQNNNDQIRKKGDIT